jgi:hypothetical protein
MKSMGQNPNKKELEAMMNEVDTDHNGYIDCGTSPLLLCLQGCHAISTILIMVTVVHHADFVLHTCVCVCVSAGEFVQLMQKQTSLSSEEEALDAWKLFKKKGKQEVISAADFRYVAFVECTHA